MAQGFMLHRRRKVVSKAFKTTWNVAVGTLTIPSQAGNYNCTVDWGDGTVPTVHTTGSLSHTYSRSGMRQISITGQYTGFRLNNTAITRSRLYYIDEWGDVGFTSMQSAFFGCNNLSKLPNSPIIGAHNVTDFSRCFADCNSLRIIPKGLFDDATSAVNFDVCFANCRITSISDGLFVKCIKARQFSRCFVSCQMHLPSTMFNYEALAALEFRPNFDDCFTHSTGNVYFITGVAYPLWDYITITSRNNCYGGQTLLTNYNDIPSNWK